ncbi:hypothetical protein C8F04DRAFT_1194555 [Mycena alexandri]|uniref:Non-specific serine/threonine protein kinase n=1 Tax=Mycena alexandri TaxID=1745969 RepID=A0AAD6S9T3_9AGAR|nr:hypothetical protein C8F04DRAFT_1194555 [Mycena alexandri]
MGYGRYHGPGQKWCSCPSSGLSNKPSTSPIAHWMPAPESIYRLPVVSRRQMLQQFACTSQVVGCPAEGTNSPNGARISVGQVRFGNRFEPEPNRTERKAQVQGSTIAQTGRHIQELLLHISTPGFTSSFIQHPNAKRFNRGIFPFGGHSVVMSLIGATLTRWPNFARVRTRSNAEPNLNAGSAFSHVTSQSHLHPYHDGLLVDRAGVGRAHGNICGPEEQESRLAANEAGDDADLISRRLFELIHSQNGTDNIGGLVAIDHLIDTPTSSPTLDSHHNLFRFYNYVKHLLPNPDPALILAASKTLGHILALGGPAFGETFMEHQVPAAVALTSTHSSSSFSSSLHDLAAGMSRYAGALILKELARNMPVQFAAYLPAVLETAVLPPLRGARMVVREAAAELLAASRKGGRDRVPGTTYLAKILADAQAGLKFNQPEVIHGSLLTYRELLLRRRVVLVLIRWQFMRDGFAEAAESILAFRAKRDAAVRRIVVSMIPTLASFNTPLFKRACSPQGHGAPPQFAGKVGRKGLGCVICFPRWRGFESSLIAIGHPATAVGADMKPFLETIMSHITTRLKEAAAAAAHSTSSHSSNYSSSHTNSSSSSNFGSGMVGMVGMGRDRGEREREREGAGGTTTAAAGRVVGGVGVAGGRCGPDVDDASARSSASFVRSWLELAVARAIPPLLGVIQGAFSSFHFTPVSIGPVPHFARVEYRSGSSRLRAVARRWCTDRLLDLLSHSLSGTPYTKLGAPQVASGTPNHTIWHRTANGANGPGGATGINQGYGYGWAVDVGAGSPSKELLTLVLNTLGSFDLVVRVVCFPLLLMLIFAIGHILTEFVQTNALPYVEDDAPEVRRAAALACCCLFGGGPAYTAPALSASLSYSMASGYGYGYGYREGEDALSGAGSLSLSGPGRGTVGYAGLGGGIGFGGMPNGMGGGTGTGSNVGYQTSGHAVDVTQPSAAGAHSAGRWDGWSGGEGGRRRGGKEGGRKGYGRVGGNGFLSSEDEMGNDKAMVGINPVPLTSSALITSTGTSPDDYFQTVVVAALLRVLKGPASNAGVEIMPAHTAVTRASVPRLQEFHLQQLAIRIGIIKQHVRNHAAEVLGLVTELWDNATLQTPIVALIEAVGRALAAELKPFLPTILPLLLKVFAVEGEIRSDDATRGSAFAPSSFPRRRTRTGRFLSASLCPVTHAPNCRYSPFPFHLVNPLPQWPWSSQKTLTA